MQPRKSDKLERIIPKWLNEISKINSILINKSKNFTDYIEKILNNDGNKEEKVFLTDSLEATIFILENNVLNKLYDIFEDIYGNELEKYSLVKEILDEINKSKEILDNTFISVKDFLKTVLITNQNSNILNDIIQQVRNKVNNYQGFVNNYISQYKKINKYLEEQKKISSKLDVI